MTFKESSKRIHNISLWRAIACLMVFTVHFGQRLEFKPPISDITNFGMYGVQFFYIISGFLIAKSYFDYGKDNPWKFYAKKAIALLPLYYIVILYYFLLHTFVFKDVPQDPTGWGWLRYIFPINSILPSTGIYFWDNLGITWTIPCFVIAYALIPILLRVVRNWKGSVILLFITLIIGKIFSVNRLHGWCSFLNDFPIFCLGVVVYFCLKEEKSLITISGLTIMAIALIVLDAATSIKYALLFAVLLIATKDLTFKSKIIQKALCVADRYSYTLYLAHGIVFTHVLDVFVLRKPIMALIAIIGSALLTFLIKNFIESPLQKLLTKALNKRDEKIIRDESQNTQN